MGEATTGRTTPQQATQRDHAGESRAAGSRIGPFLTWFAVLGGVVAWLAHLSVAWADMEISCFVRYPGYVLQHGGHPSGAEYAVTYGATAVPWLVALLALLAAIRLRVLVGRLDDDDLAKGRLHLLSILGLYLDAMMLAAITGGAIALYVLEPC
jgi:hypothetical protein